jgi:hypothetical protein
MISEWGSNPNPVTGSMVYDFGKVCIDNTGTCDNATKTGWQPDWTLAWWRSGQDNATPSFAYKRGRIQSTHSVNPTLGVATVSGVDYAHTEIVDNVANIRCSYCHDVHNLNQAVGDNVTGQPYLRGTWRGNPYKEDGAPQSGTVYASGNTYGSVPRGGTQYTAMGGYFIGQNTPVNDNTQTPANFAGLCNLCHNPAAAAAQYDSLDYTTGENLWIGTNGHSAVVIGGTGGNKANIFDFTHGRPIPNVPSKRNYSNQVASQGLVTSPLVSGAYSYRGAKYGGNYWPALTANFPYAFKSYNWGATVDNTTTNYPYHKFTCSKCHNPHASRLPKLLITNCLDIRHNTWQNSGSTQSLWTSSTLTDIGKKTAYYDSAQNCHRRDDGQNAKNPGWNKVSPW